MRLMEKQKELDKSKSSLRKSIGSQKAHERYATGTEEGDDSFEEDDYSYDEAELEVLRRINLEVADLVEINRKL